MSVAMLPPGTDQRGMGEGSDRLSPKNPKNMHDTYRIYFVFRLFSEFITTTYRLKSFIKIILVTLSISVSQQEKKNIPLYICLKLNSGLE